MTQTRRSCGSWTSPLSPSLVAQAALAFGDVQVHGGQVYWSERRPSERGRSVVMTLKDQTVCDLLPSPYHARSRVHEFGGSSFSVGHNALFFSNFKDGHFYALSPDGVCTDLSRKKGHHYADPLFDPKRNLIYAIEEEHTSQGEVINRIVKIDPTGQREVETVCEGCDFYASMTLHPDGDQLAFLSWNHPHMPWDQTELFIAKLNSDGKALQLELVAGKAKESIFQPLWSQEGVLYFISDQTGWWNLYQVKQGGAKPCYPVEAEFGDPQWVFGLSRYAFLKEGEIAAFYTEKGVDTLSLIDPKKKQLTPIDLPFTEYRHLRASGDTLFFIGASPSTLPALFSYDTKTHTLQTVRENSQVPIDSGYLSCPETLTFPTRNRKEAFGFYYPPKNKDFSKLEDEKPPLIVKCHGGPTARTTSSLKLSVQFWTSRGFAFLDVNYGGSSGYGRAYRERLNGHFGKVDVDDCISGAHYLIARGAVDQHRLIIKGGSSGGYTALAALTFHSCFAIGASYYGIGDLEALTQETHKFEAHYFDTLIAPYPEHQEQYRENSPLNHTDKLSSPIIFFQGDRDNVVPPSQSKKMFEALKEKGIPTAYLLFQGEGHGFSQKETIQSTLNAELYFYSKILRFELKEPLTPIPIANLPT